MAIVCNGAVGHSVLQLLFWIDYRQMAIVCNGAVQRFSLCCCFFFLLSVAERTFKQVWYWLPGWIILPLGS